MGSTAVLAADLAVAPNGSKERVGLAYLQAMIDVLGLDICADTIIGNAMRRGVSGGQKKRVTTGVSLLVMCLFWCKLHLITGPKAGEANVVAQKGMAEQGWLRLALRDQVLRRPVRWKVPWWLTLAAG